MNKKQRDEVFTRFINGQAIAKLADEFDERYQHIFQIIDDRLPFRINIGQNIIKKICSDYYNGKNVEDLTEKYKINHVKIKEILTDNGFCVEEKKSRRRIWNIDENYFDKIDTPNKAYVLGLLYADGYNSLATHTARIMLQERDKDILVKISAQLQYEKPLGFVKCSDHVASNGFISKDMYSLSISSPHICEELALHGVLPNKSLILEYPDWMPEKFNRHFIRGYFDGDGSFCRQSKRTSNYLITFTSTEDFCVDCLNILRKNLGIGGGIYDASCHNGITRVLSISGKDQCKKILDWLYEDADIYMDRKYNHYREVFYS